VDSTEQHFNLVVLGGAVAAPPELAGPYESSPGRLLLTVRSTHPPRVDLIPISDVAGRIPADAVSGDRLWVVGSLQRRFSPATGRSRLEVAACHIQRRPFEDLIGASGGGRFA
jgi:hypothetical protein